nr:LysR family transcriptional regulator [Kineosporia mesophila]
MWARLDTRHFVTLAEVVSTGSFTAAAQSLGYTQSAVSQQIARLERMLGQPVLHRSAGGRTVSLTPAGRVLLQHASSLVATMQRAAADVSALSEGIAGILRVGCFESVGSSLLPIALESFLQDYPRVQLELTELADDGDLLDLLSRDELDLTFVVFPLAAGPYESQALLEDPYVLVVAQDSPMAGISGAVDLSDYPELPLMSYGKMRDVHAIETRLGRPVYGSRVVFRSNHTSTLLSLVRLGHAAAVLPRLAVRPPQPGLRVLELERVNPRIVGVAWPTSRPLSDPASGFVQALGQAADDYRPG